MHALDIEIPKGFHVQPETGKADRPEDPSGIGFEGLIAIGSQSQAHQLLFIGNGDQVFANAHPLLPRVLTSGISSQRPLNSSEA